MSPTQRTAALRLADEIDHGSASLEWVDSAHRAAALLRELAAEPQSEPVAWKFSRRYGSGLSFTKPEPEDDDDEFLPPVPLYAHPPRTAPLTEAQIVDALAGAGCCGKVSLAYDSGPYEITRPTCAAITLVRAIEAAHGIGETK